MASRVAATTDRPMESNPDHNSLSSEAPTSSAEVSPVPLMPMLSPPSARTQMILDLTADKADSMEKEQTRFSTSTQESEQAQVSSTDTKKGMGEEIDFPPLERGRIRNVSSPGAYNISTSGMIRPAGNVASLPGTTEYSETFSAPPPMNGDGGSKNNDLLVEATTIPEPESEQEIEERVRKHIIEKAVVADVVPETNNKDHSSQRKSRKVLCYLFIGVLICAVILAVALGLGFGVDDSSDGNSMEQPSGGSVSSDTDTAGNDPAETAPAQVEVLSTLEAVLDRGYIRCGVYDDMPGFSYLVEGEYSGFNFELCKAVAAAVFGDKTKYELVVISAFNRFTSLVSGDVDLISQSVSQTMERDLNELTSGSGLTFSYPFYFSGLLFGGLPEYVDCAQQFDPFTGVCREMRVCVLQGTIQEAFLSQVLTGSAVVRFETPKEAIDYMNDATCNVIAAEAVTLNPQQLTLYGLSPEIDFVLGNATYSRDPLSLVTSDDDVDWSDIVNSVVKIVYTAENLNLTSSNVETEMEKFPDLNEVLSERTVRVVSAVGNYVQLYHQELSFIFSIRSEANNLYRGGSGGKGLLYSYPFGTTFRDNYPTQTPSQTIIGIQTRGFLRCGVVLSEGFAMYEESTDTFSGLDVEFCGAIAASIFVGDPDRVEFVVLNSTNCFPALSEGTIDVLMGQELTLTNEFFEPTTGDSFAFTEPYFWSENFESRAMVTRHDDSTWSSFVYWVETAIVYAEENGIDSTSAIEMPAVSYFGESLLQCFRDCIAAVGNYGEIYNRTMETTVPRGGANLLNSSPYGPQQVGYPLA